MGWSQPELSYIPNVLKRVLLQASSFVPGLPTGMDLGIKLNQMRRKKKKKKVLSFKSVA